MNAHHLHAVLIQFRISFLTYFTALTDDDLAEILKGPSETLLEVLQLRYGYTPEQAKGEWNEFVLRHIDGHHPAGGSVPPGSSQSPEVRVALQGQHQGLQPGQHYTHAQPKVYPSLWPPHSMGWWWLTSLKLAQQAHD